MMGKTALSVYAVGMLIVVSVFAQNPGTKHVPESPVPSVTPCLLSVVFPRPSNQEPAMPRSAEPETGTICVAARADDPFRGQVISPTGEVSPAVCKVRSTSALLRLGHRERVSKLRDWI